MHVIGRIVILNNLSEVANNFFYNHTFTKTARTSR